MEFLRSWFERNFSNPQVVLLALVLVALLLGIVFLGQILAPLIASLVIAYVLDAPADTLRKRGAPHLAAVTIVFLTFLLVIVVSLVAIVPLLSQQLTQLVTAMPSMVTAVQDLLLRLPEQYPDLVSPRQITELGDRLRGELLSVGQSLLMISFDRIGNLILVIVYLFLVPFLVFFFLKDKHKLQRWFVRVLPSDRELVTAVWREVDEKCGAYVRGKIYEIAIVGGVAWALFTALDLQFAVLLGALTGLSVLIPYVGVAAVSVPVFLVAYFQFQISGEFAAVIGGYSLLQLIDGNVLAPLLISEVVDLHPVAVISAILIFGGIWGFWGVFFAIPLATLAVAVQNAWPEPGAPGPTDA